MAPDGASVVLQFVNAFNSEDLEAFGEVLHPEVVIHSARGARRGIDEALAWARRVPEGELHQAIELDSIRVEGDDAVALVRKQWWWRESNELAREDEMAWVFELREGKVSSWRPVEDRAEALAALAAAG
jgi:limonene-1,2-epoxide hydrolase